MMDRMYYVRRGPGLLVRVLLNELCFHVGISRTYDGTSGPAAHWLVPGSNVLRLEILSEDPAQHPRAFANASITGPGESPVHARLDFPEFFDERPAEERRFPAIAERAFVLDGDVPEPLWRSESPEEIPPEGTDELRAAVFTLHQALARRDARALVDAMLVKIQDLSRYYGGGGLLDPGEMQLDYEERFREPLEVSAFEPEKLRFQSLHGGRVVHVTRTDGERAIHAQNATRERGMSLDPFFVRQRGSWRLYR